MTEQARKNSRKRGKNYEYRVAKKVKGVRVGLSSGVQVGDTWIKIDCTHAPDIVSIWLSIEAKHWKTLPAWLHKVMAQAVNNAPEGLVPIAWVGDRETKSNFVIMREKDFLDNFVGENG